MRTLNPFLFCILLLAACKSSKSVVEPEGPNLGESVMESDFTIAFGSCNKHDSPNQLWDDVLATEPDLWIWGGDNIYADTDDMLKMRGFYSRQNKVEGYAELKKQVPIIGTWDDHDYGVNDGGTEFAVKKDSQQEFLDFMEVPKDSPRRKREGIYTSHDYNTPEGSIKVIILDTRYFRTALTPDTESGKRTKPNAYGEGTVLGEAQWKWLKEELNNTNADFNLIVSSIQVLSNEHGFETWGNFPHEVDTLKETIVDSGARGVIVLSGDRHISEFSQTSIEGLPYPLIDFTSSGLTHAYREYKGEPNPFRVGETVFTESFGLLRFNFEEGRVLFNMLGDDGKVLGKLAETY